MPDLPPRTPIVDAPLSVILLSHGDQPQLEDVVSAWSALLDELARPAAEILLVQDSVTEAATHRAESLAQRFPRVRVLRFETSMGEGRALQTAFSLLNIPGAMAAGRQAIPARRSQAAAR